MSKDKPVSICFIALRAYSLLSGKNYNDVKGPNVRQVVLARELVKEGFKISFICYHNEQQGEQEIIDGIRIFKMSDTNGFSFLKKLIDAFKLLSLIMKADSEIYIHNGGFIGALTLLARKKNILMMASDAFINKTLINKKIRGFSSSKLDLDNIGMFLSIKMADSVTVQNETQKNLLEQNFQVEGKLIRNPIPHKNRFKKTYKQNPPIVLWVGSLAEVKQPQLFVELARDIPDVKFQMIGGKSGSPELYQEIMYGSHNLDNFEYLGVIPYEKIDQYFCKATILVNTSLFEGFPNSFLQAWINYLPVVSLNVNPDNILSTYSMGLHSKNFRHLKDDVKNLLCNSELMMEMGLNGRMYVEEHHDIKFIVLDYVNLIYSLTEH